LSEDISPCYKGTFRVKLLLDPARPKAIPMGSLLRVYTHGMAHWFDGVYSGWHQTDPHAEVTFRFLTEDGEELVKAWDVKDVEVLHRY
jgi:hypothetical protein